MASSVKSSIEYYGISDPENTAGPLLPRELAPGVQWIGDCMLWPTPDHLEHSYTATFLVEGAERSLLVDSGHPKDWKFMMQHLDKLMAAGAPPLEYIFPTHPEVTHSGNLGRLLERYPDAKAVGDMRDFQLIWPQHVDRMEGRLPGDKIDLGGRNFVLVEAIFRDLLNSVWGYDEQEQVLFSSDGLGFGHYHGAEHCGKFAEEIPDMPIPELSGIFLEYALFWTRLKDVEPHLERLRHMMEDEYPVRIIAGAHGSPVSDPDQTLPLVREGVRMLAERYSLR